MEISQESPLMMSSSSEVSSPEFEFWMVDKNPSLPQPSLLTADELFVDGVLLPLHLLPLSHPNPNPNPTPNSAPESPAELLNVEPLPPSTSPPPPPPRSSVSAVPPTGRPKKWKDVPKAREKGAEDAKDRRKERRGSAGGPAELNINIWPFSRSRSAGNAGTGSWSRARAAVAGRKVSSAPCSRSNSRGESSKPTTTTTPSSSSSSSSRRWAPSASRVAAFAGGIHLGRANPVWKIHKKINQAADPKVDKANVANINGSTKKGGSNAGVRVLNFHVNTCIGYRTRDSCSSTHASSIVGSGGGGASGSGGGGNGGSNSSLFKLRAIFSKNVY